MPSNSPEKDPGEDEALLSRPPELVDLIAEIRNYSREDRSVILFDLITLCYVINSSEEDRERGGELIAKLCNLFRFGRGRSIAAFLLEKGATTRLELESETGIEETPLSRKLNVLKGLGIVDNKGRVGTPYRAPSDRGAGIPVWRLKYSSPQASIDAQKRYGDLIKIGEQESRDEKELEEQLEIQQREAQREARVQKVQDIKAQVLDMLPRPLTLNSGPIYDVLDELGVVDSTLRRDVTEGTLWRIKGIMGA